MSDKTDTKGELCRAMWNLSEKLTGMELRDSARALMVHYFNESTAGSPSDRARDAVQRYAPADIPPLAEVRQRRHSLSETDHLVLKLEYAASLVPPDVRL